jgi:23S rRNA (guanosine2251-2'-O)-methyltransferase
MSDLIYGRNPVLSCLNGNRKIEKVLISKTINDPKFATLCQKRGVSYKFVSVNELNSVTKNQNHQGVVCYLKEFEYTELDEFLDKVKSKTESIVVLLDGVEDPVNFGSIIRTSSCFNVDGIIISKNRQVQMTPTVSKVATGAEEFVDIVRVTNLNQTITQLKKEGYWVVSSDGYGKSNYTSIDYSGKICLVVGSEGRGISKLVLQNSDFVCKIPISGPITSLNASISAAIFLAHIVDFKQNKQ